MITITETIHHGNYRSTRVMQVPVINSTTVRALLMSSPYCYTETSETRVNIVRDELATSNRAEHGWSTFTAEGEAGR